ncbi:MAG TPA: PH domain-containing protein [Mycobacteriales bacterium]|nr:PH domain-containing protein [Mycobacteriales bacterium]
MEPAPVHPSPGSPPPQGRWFPRPVETTLAAGGALLALLLAVVADPAGRLLFAVAALGLLALAAADLILRPRLAADPTGVRIRTLGVRTDLPWSAIERVAVDERSRRGLTARTLELDAGGTLVVLGRRALGADPREVADALARIRYTRPVPD